MIKKKPRILIIRCGLLGDTVDATAVVKPLVDYYGESLEIEWVTKPNLKDLFKYDARITPLFIKYTKLPILLSKDKLKIIINSLVHPYDAVINLELGDKFINLARFTRGKVKAGLPYKHIYENIKNEHRVKHQLRILKSCFSNLKTDDCYPYLNGSNADIKKMYNIHNKYIVICPTNSHFKKKNYRGYRAWPISNWQELINKVINETNLDIVVTGSNNEKSYMSQLDLYNPRIHNLTGRTIIPNLVEIMKNSECTIATDSGSVHVAGISSKKVIALHGPTSFYETGPFGNGKNRVIQASLNLRCSPCYNTQRIKMCHSNKCMIKLSPDMIFNYIMQNQRMHIVKKELKLK